jgi:hypothetical protein
MLLRCSSRFDSVTGMIENEADGPGPCQRR